MTSLRLVLAASVLVFAGAVAACSDTPPGVAATAASTTSTVTTASPPTTARTTVPDTTVPDTTVPVVTETRQIGTSLEGRSITAIRRGEVGGRVVLVIGVIHGDEAAGAQVVDRLEQLEVPAGVDLWLVPSMNPDGQSAVDRHNANQVDLNRNFPYRWGPIGVPGDGQYAGTGPASEPETQSMVAFIDEIRPDLVIWYHQDLFRIAPGTGRDGVIRARYAELVGLPVVSITGGTYTGVAATWARQSIDPGVAFIVELGPTLSDAEADVHARAVLVVASEPN
ncbi:MAG: M14 family zinc carboxypeptidase [Ilumatobacteraceae bacterium]